jgi:hypothetical protein
MIYHRNKYCFNKDSLEYKKIPISIKKIVSYVLFIMILTGCSFFILSTFYNTPKEKKTKKTYRIVNI